MFMGLAESDDKDEVSKDQKKADGPPGGRMEKRMSKAINKYHVSIDLMKHAPADHCGEQWLCNYIM